MDCRRFRETFSDFADGLVDEGSEVAMCLHIAECEACRRFEAAFRAGCGIMRDLEPVRASEDFDLRLHERILRECRAAELEGPGALRQFASVAGALVIVVAAGVVGWEARGTRFVEASGTAIRRQAGTLRAPGHARFVHDTAWARDPFRVLPPRRDTAGPTAPRHYEITVDWIVP